LRSYDSAPASAAAKKPPTFAIFDQFWYKIVASSLARIQSLIYNVADPGCLSRIPDSKTATKEKGEKI
jgi:hypothetical protein